MVNYYVVLKVFDFKLVFLLLVRVYNADEPGVAFKMLIERC